jgi:hypothetical protein
VTEVDLAPEVVASLRAMKDHGSPPPRCHKGPIRSAIAGAVRRLLENDLSGGVRPWGRPGLQGRAAALGDVSSARAVSVDENVLAAELSCSAASTMNGGSSASPTTQTSRFGPRPPGASTCTAGDRNRC